MKNTSMVVRNNSLGSNDIVVVGYSGQWLGHSRFPKGYCCESLILQQFTNESFYNQLDNRKKEYNV